MQPSTYRSSHKEDATQKAKKKKRISARTRAESPAIYPRASGVRSAFEADTTDRPSLSGRSAAYVAIRPDECRWRSRPRVVARMGDEEGTNRREEASRILSITRHGARPAGTSVRRPHCPRRHDEDANGVGMAACPQIGRTRTKVARLNAKPMGGI